MPKAWDRMCQNTRETFGGDKSSLPSDIAELTTHSEMMKKNYESMVSRAEGVLPDDYMKLVSEKIATKEKATRLPIHKFGTVLKTSGHELSAFPVGPVYDQAGSTIQELAEIEADFFQQLYQGFVMPKNQMLKGDMTSAQSHLEKLRSRRIDVDAVKHKIKDAKPEKAGKYEETLRVAQLKFDESLSIVRQQFTYLRETTNADSNQQVEVMAMMQAFLEYHRRSYELLKSLDEKVNFKQHADVSLKIPPEAKYQNYSPQVSQPSLAPVSPTSGGESPPAPLPRAQAKVLFDFKPVHDGDLELHSGDMVELLKKEGDWWEGVTKDGRRGVFPSNYVESGV